MLDKNAIQEIYNKKERTPAEDFIFNTLEDIEYIKNRFVVIGYRLVEAVKNDYVFDLGYSDITQLAEEVFGIKKSMTYALMSIAKYYCNGMELKEKYKPFSQTQLIELARTPVYLCSSITPDMSSRDIIDFRKALSGYKTSYEGIDMSEPDKIINKYRENKQAEKNLKFFEDSSDKDNSMRVENCEQFEMDLDSDFSRPLYLLQWSSADGEFMYGYSSFDNLASVIKTFPSTTKFRVFRLSSIVMMPKNDITSIVVGVYND